MEIAREPIILFLKKSLGHNFYMVRPHLIVLYTSGLGNASTPSSLEVPCLLITIQMCDLNLYRHDGLCCP